MFFSTDGPGDLIFLTWTPETEQETDTLQIRKGYRQIADCLLSKRAVLLHERIYGNARISSSTLELRNTVYRENDVKTEIPPTFVEGTPCNGYAVAGIHAVAIQQYPDPEPPVVRWKNRPCGRALRGQDADYLALSDVGSLVRQVGKETPGEETRKTFAVVEEVLNQSQWTFHDVRRTWFYLQNILDWYNEFNQIRNTAFKHLGILNGNPLGAIPASTGIQGRNADGGWCTLDLLAIRAVPGQSIETRRLVNPKQNEAPQYGSAFARALSVKTARCQYLFVSGTASIDEHGVSVYPGDFEKQTIRTLENVSALLATAGAKLQDICQATAFVKRPEDVKLYHSIAHRMGLDRVPVVCTLADVCRDDLLYELDATAVLPD